MARSQSLSDKAMGAGPSLPPITLRGEGGLHRWFGFPDSEKHPSQARRNSYMWSPSLFSGEACRWTGASPRRRGTCRERIPLSEIFVQESGVQTYVTTIFTT